MWQLSQFNVSLAQLCQSSFFIFILFSYTSTWTTFWYQHPRFVNIPWARYKTNQEIIGRKEGESGFKASVSVLYSTHAGHWSKLILNVSILLKYIAYIVTDTNMCMQSSLIDEGKTKHLTSSDCFYIVQYSSVIVTWYTSWAWGLGSWEAMAYQGRLCQ